MTEVTCTGLSFPAGVDDDTGSVGVILPNCEIKLVNESGKEVGVGERGEIYIKGPNVSLGYWNNEKATRETMLGGGWLRTGDVAISDERGWFWIVDRLKVHPHLYYISKGFREVIAGFFHGFGRQEGQSLPGHPPVASQIVLTQLRNLSKYPASKLRQLSSKLCF